MDSYKRLLLIPPIKDKMEKEKVEIIFDASKLRVKKSSERGFFLKTLRLKKIRRYTPLRFSGGEEKNASAIQIIGYTGVVNVQELCVAGVHV